MNERITTEYFANTDTMRAGRVHVLADGEPVCGTKVRGNGYWAWCGHGVQPEYLTCERCREWYRERRAAPQ